MRLIMGCPRAQSSSHEAHHRMSRGSLGIVGGCHEDSDVLVVTNLIVGCQEDHDGLSE